VGTFNVNIACKLLATGDSTFITHRVSKIVEYNIKSGKSIVLVDKNNDIIDLLAGDGAYVNELGYVYAIKTQRQLGYFANISCVVDAYPTKHAITLHVCKNMQCERTAEETIEKWELNPLRKLFSFAKQPGSVSNVTFLKNGEVAYFEEYRGSTSFIVVDNFGRKAFELDLQVTTDEKTIFECKGSILFQNGTHVVEYSISRKRVLAIHEIPAKASLKAVVPPGMTLTPKG
jgi:hypothetical protein